MALTLNELKEKRKRLIKKVRKEEERVLGLQEQIQTLDKEKTTLEKSRSLRSPMLSFANTDMAFRDDILVAGSYHGFNIYKLNDDGIKTKLGGVWHRQSVKNVLNTDINAYVN